MENAKKDELIQSLVTRGVENIIPSREKLVKLLNSGKTLNIYLGIDPTATRIHLGHAFPLRKLQILADLGHKITFLIGDFTAKVGDTSDKETERPILTDEEIKTNFETYKRQASKFLDFSKVEVHHNSEWLSKLNFGDILNIAKHFSLNDFVSRELIKKRMTKGDRVGLPELIYPIMQGYDSLHLDTDIQLGGTDQTFNMQAGRTLLWNLKQKESFVMANGFLPGTDGRKMSKTWNNAIWLEDSPEEIYGKVMSVSDDVLVTYFEMGTNVENWVIEDVRKRLAAEENPMNLKKELAKIIVAELCGDDAVEQAEEHFQKAVVDKDAPEGVGIVDRRSWMVDGGLKIFGEGKSLLRILMDNKLVESGAEFKRLLDEGAIYKDEVRLTRESVIDKPGVVRVGKRKYLKFV